MEPVEYREMAYVIAVYEQRSFSRAAKHCFVSQPSLSKTVKKVEKNLGCEIFDRGSSPLEATPEGKNIIAHFRKIMELHQRLEYYCESVRRQRKTGLTIGAPSFFCTCLLPPAVADFQLSHPGFQIKIIESNDNDLRKFLRAGVIDIGLSVEEEMPSELKAVDLREETIILAVPAGYAVNRGLERHALTPEELSGGGLGPSRGPGLRMDVFSGERFLLLKRGNDMYRRSMDICHDAGFEPLVVMELDQMLTAYYLATAGEGIAFVRSSLPHYVGDLDKLRFYRIDHPATVRMIRVFCHGDRPLNVQQRTFVSFLREYLSPG